LSSHGQNVQVTQVVQNKGCLSGCGTVFAILIVVALVTTYWYVAVPVAVLAVAGGVYWYYRQRGELPAPHAGPQDRWFDQVVARLDSLGFSEQTRNTGPHLVGVPMEGDLCLDGDGLRLFVNVFSNTGQANQAAEKLQMKSDFKQSIATGHTAVIVRDRLVYVASGLGGPVNSNALNRAMKAVGEPLSSTPGEPAQIEAPPTARADADVLDQLRKLGELRDSGVLSHEEFEAKKAELLKRL
jgi:hypothetical protein